MDAGFCENADEPDAILLNAPKPDCSLEKAFVDVVSPPNAPPGAGVAGVVLVVGIVAGLGAGVAGGVAAGVTGVAVFSGVLAGVVEVVDADEVADDNPPNALAALGEVPNTDLCCSCASLGLSSLAAVAHTGFASLEGDFCAAAVLNVLGPAVAKLANPPPDGVVVAGFIGVVAGVDDCPNADCPNADCPVDGWPNDDWLNELWPNDDCPKDDFPKALP